MVRIFQRASRRVALPPGTPEFAGQPRIPQARIHVISYGPDFCEERDAARAEDCFPLRAAPALHWVNVDGLHDTALLQAFADRLGLHPLVVEDIVSTHQRPKLEDYQDYLFVVLRMLSYDEAENEIASEQLGLIVGANYVASFQEIPGDMFDAVRERLRTGKGRLRSMGPDYLAYALIDAVVDSYFVILERLGEKIEDLEEELLERPTPALLQQTHELKREMILLRRSVWPLREVVSSLERGEAKLFEQRTRVFLRDLYDHTIQVIDAVETYRDILTGLQDLYLSSVSNKMNEVMKVLTMIATLFIPVSFLAGVFGMNFEHMPELGWRWSYPIFWAVIVAVIVGMLVWFRRKKWL